MPLYLDPDSDQTCDGPLFELPAHLRAHAQTMHAAAVVLGRFCVLLRGPTGSGKSFLQRQLRQQADWKGLYSALISDDYIQLARAPLRFKQTVASACPPLLAFAPVVTRRLEEVRGVGVISISRDDFVEQAVVSLLVDLVHPVQMERMPTRENGVVDCLGHSIARMSVPQRSALAASELIFARLSTWKDGC
ncbi:HPr kinase/phosphorylase [Cohaesibacter celericrescens]|uniref:Uncharacterized protein n=1 Tax=Cohaesibacter celericrescens TaxID=2067669 RepID=A0A2N5XUP7_9HYPH|nr:hypothetical protein [Cohaesibacter celericrescens]PLW78177.1 hypothetical protein C0081_05910 [Cohaesibacter celericrescens]